MSSVETGQMSAVETGQMTAAETSVLSQQKTSVLFQQQTSNIENWNWELSKPCMGLYLSFVGGCRGCDFRLRGYVNMASGGVRSQKLMTVLIVYSPAHYKSISNKMTKQMRFKSDFNIVLAVASAVLSVPSI